MSSVDFRAESSSSSSLVNKILEQGQRLRNSMVQTILNNDPFNKEILSSNSLRNEKGGHLKSCSDRELSRSHIVDRDRIRAYMDGEEMCMEEEEQILSRIRSLSPKSLVRTISNDCKCQCSICKDYEKLTNLKSSSNITIDSKPSCDRIYKFTSARSGNQDIKSYKKVKNSTRDNLSILKYVDSLKIFIYSLKLNLAGIRKITSSNTFNFPLTNTTYFIEYALPEFFIKNIPKSKAKVNSGLNPKNTIRYCSKKYQGESIYFRQQTIHTISSIEMLDLSTLNIVFQIGCRNVRQRVPECFGIARFNLGALVLNNKFSCDQELIVLSENTLVNLGSLKVTIQFGCDRLHFGKEFVDAISYGKENCSLSENDSIFNAQIEEPNLIKKSTKIVNDKQNLSKPEEVQQNFVQKENKLQEDKQIATTPREIIVESPLHSIRTFDPILLYGLVYIEEARILSKPLNFYITCQGFTNKTEKKFSRIVYNSFKPVFNFYQLFPVIYNEKFINHLQDTELLIELWEKADGEENLIGKTILPLTQLYVIYKDPTISKHLCKNQHPVIAFDWWEPIVNQKSNLDFGQLRVLVALGTEEQIKILQCSKDINRIQTPINTYRSIESHRTDYFDQPVVNEHSKIFADKYAQEPDVEIIPFSKPSPKKIDACTSTSSEMEPQEKNNSNSNNTNNVFTQHGFLNSFIEQLLAAKEIDQRNKLVENSTNTEEIISKNDTPLKVNNIPVVQESPKVSSDCLNNVPNVSSIRNTSDLLDTLQEALAVGQNNVVIEQNKQEDTKKYFKAHIVIHSALHLPSRKKCKSKKNRNKNIEEILPSTFVTFKTMNENDIIITTVVPKNKNPQWDFRCDVQLPADLLFNDQKRLVFKVWRKANGPSLQPNLQTDIVIGFATLDLTVLLSGLPNVQGWFNIVDFANHCNGQIKIHVTPLENLSIFNEYKKCYIPEKLKQKVPEQIVLPEPDEIPSELFSRALKRKFTELEEITQRLKQRLSTVTNDDSDISNDDFADEFEKDLNTECIEQEKLSFDSELNIATNMETINMDGFNNDNERVLMLDDKNKSTEEESIAKPSTSKSVSDNITTDSLENQMNDQPPNENNILDLNKHLSEGKLRIDTLLEKLSLFTEDLQKNDNSFSSRYVSGCSVSHDSEGANNNSTVLQDIGQKAQDNFDSNLIFNPLLFQKLFSTSTDSTTPDLSKPSMHTLHNLVDSFSSSSVDTDTSGSGRQAPDGAGNSNNT